MKSILLLACCLLLGVATKAQTAAPTVTVRGTVIDSATNKPLDFVTVAVTDAATKQPVKSTLTKENGGFEIKGLPQKSYQLSLVYIGYRSKTLDLKGTGTTLDGGKVLLSSTSKQLNDVTVTALKPLMKREVDRISYDVQADPEAKSLTGLDLMRKVPMLSVDADDNIKLRGNGNYKILLNGKESSLMARSPADVLKAMPASNIEKIEVITSPPAKYDAEGLAGVINIITKKNADQGYNGSANVNYNSVWGQRLNLNGTVKQGKFGYSGYVGTGTRKTRYNDFTNNTTFYNTAAADPTTIASSQAQTGQRGNGGDNFYTSNELSFEFDSLNLITGSANYYNNSNNSYRGQFTSQFDANDALTRSFNAINQGNGRWKGADLAVNYQLGFKRNKEQLLTASYKYSTNAGDQNNNITTSQPGLPSNYLQFNNAGTKEYTTQLDYIHPMKKLTIEAGGKMILRNNYSKFNRQDSVAPGQYAINPAFTNDFNYHQDVYSVYNSYTLKFTKWVFKGGLRFERTAINANFQSAPNQNFSLPYQNLVPSFSAQRELKNSSLNFGFTQRIQRPGIWQLNPFVDQSNPLYISQGNPNLRPSVNNNFELGYSNFTKGSINISANYAFANNTIQDVSTVNGMVTTSTYANVGKEKRLGLDLSLNYPITKQLNANINAEITRVWLAGNFNGDYLTNSGQQGHVFSNFSYKLENGWRFGMNVNFDSRYVMLQGVDNYWFGNGLNGSKELFKGKATIGVFVNNPLKEFNRLDFITRTKQFYTYAENYNFYRSININFSYKFGKLNANIKKNQRGISNDDTSGGGRN